MKALVVVALLLLCISSRAEPREKRNITKTINQYEFVKMDFCSWAKEIKWVVNCEHACYIYLLTLDDFADMGSGKDFRYFVYSHGKIHAGSWLDAENITQGLVIAAINREHPLNTVLIEIEQSLLSTSWSPPPWLILIGVLIGIVLCWGCFIGCLVCCLLCSGKPHSTSETHVSQTNSSQTNFQYASCLRCSGTGRDYAGSCRSCRGFGCYHCNGIGSRSCTGCYGVGVVHRDVNA